MLNKISPKLLSKFLIFLAIFSLGLGLGSKYINKNPETASKQEEKNTPKAFISEIYDKIKANYWDNISDAQLLDLFKLSFDKNGGSVTAAKFDNKDSFLNAFNDTIKSMNDEQKNKFITNMAGSVLASLNPAGRSGLYTQKNEQQLKNTVNNVNPQKDLYKDLGVATGSSKQTVQTAYQKQAEELKNDNSPEAQQKLKQLTYAKEVLSKDDTKQRYDQSKVEPTIFTKIISPGILYVQYKKFSPTSYDEFLKAFDSYKNDPTLTGLIFDLRGNIGGAIDATPYFLGNFIGKNQYAFDFYHKGEYLPFKTPTDKLVSISKYKQVVILIDNQTQSSAEIMTASFKKYHIGVAVGTPTKGWGTVERVFPLDNQISKGETYSIFLVHSITLREDNQPIEGRGVEPDINITSPTWPQQLLQYFNDQPLLEAVKAVLNPA